MNYNHRNEINPETISTGKMVSIFVTALLPFCIGAVIVAVLLQ